MIPTKRSVSQRRPHVAGNKAAITMGELNSVLHSTDLLTVDWTQDAKARLDDARDLTFGRPDSLDEDCNNMEVALGHIVLRAIAEERCENPLKCAEIVVL